MPSKSSSSGGVLVEVRLVICVLFHAVLVAFAACAPGVRVGLETAGILLAIIIRVVLVVLVALAACACARRAWGP